LQLKEIGDFNRDAFAVEDFSFNTNYSTEHIDANFF